MNDRSKVIEESIKRLLRRNATSHLANIVNKTHAADLSLIFRTISIRNQQKLFEMIDDFEKKAVLISELEEYTFLDFIETLSLEDIVEIMTYMRSDDVAELLRKFPAEKSEKILEMMKSEESDEVEELMRYGNETAGGIMVPEFIAFNQELTAGEAIESLQNDHKDVEMAFYLYITDDYDNLVGVSSLRQLVVEKPDTRLKEFMTTDVFSVRTDMDQEEVAAIVARYDILAVPVVDENNRLVGIVTVDDVIDIIRKEATEDILKMAGVGEEFVETQSVFSSTKIRLPWLFASCLGGIAAFFIIGHFEDSLAKYAYLAAFIPVIMGMGGNIGTQSSTIVVRGLATGRIHIEQLRAVVLKELAIGSILGLIYGTLIGTVAHARFYLEVSNGMLAVSVGLAVVSSMAVAALVGSFVPMVFGKLSIDPAVATGPFVTTAVDIISVYFYFKIATTLLAI